jgi:hypothetical protein
MGFEMTVAKGGISYLNNSFDGNQATEMGVSSTGPVLLKHFRPLAVSGRRGGVRAPFKIWSSRRRYPFRVLAVPLDLAAQPFSVLVQDPKGLDGPWCQCSILRNTRPTFSWIEFVPKYVIEITLPDIAYSKSVDPKGFAGSSPAIGSALEAMPQTAK